MKKICPLCQLEFVTSNKLKIYCSDCAKKKLQLSIYKYYKTEKGKAWKKAYRAIYKAKHPITEEQRERWRKYQYEWRRKNPEKYFQIHTRFNQKRKRRRLAFRFRLFQAANFTCQYCGRKAPDVELQIDHILPRKHNGPDSVDNYKVSCAECNLGKNDFLLNEFGADKSGINILKS